MRVYHNALGSVTKTCVQVEKVIIVSQQYRLRHTKYKKQDTRSGNTTIYFIFKFKNPFILLYNQYNKTNIHLCFRSRLDYCTTIWDPYEAEYRSSLKERNGSSLGSCAKECTITIRCYFLRYLRLEWSVLTPQNYGVRFDPYFSAYFSCGAK